MHRPSRFSLPDLSGLDDKLTANYILSASFGRVFPPGDAQHLVTAFVRSTESALRRYEEARLRLERSTTRDSLVDYLRVRRHGGRGHSPSPGHASGRRAHEVP
jgi:hypothetical protein